MSRLTQSDARVLSRPVGVEWAGWRSDTHSLQQAGRVSDYTAFLYLGRLIEYSETEELFVRPKRKETEDYITGRFG